MNSKNPEKLFCYERKGSPCHAACVNQGQRDCQYQDGENRAFQKPVVFSPLFSSLQAEAVQGQRLLPFRTAAWHDVLGFLGLGALTNVIFDNVVPWIAA